MTSWYRIRRMNTVVVFFPTVSTSCPICFQSSVTITTYTHTVTTLSHTDSRCLVSPVRIEKLRHSVHVWLLGPMSVLAHPSTSEMPRRDILSKKQQKRGPNRRWNKQDMELAGHESPTFPVWLSSPLPSRPSLLAPTPHRVSIKCRDSVVPDDLYPR